MVKKTRVFIVIVVMLLFGILLYFIINPPLEIRGISANVEQAGNSTSDKENPFIIVAQPENNGFVNIRLREVLINSNEKPIKAELGVGRSNHMVMVTQALGNVEEDEEISFHEISEYAIRPLTKIQNEQTGPDSINHYGITVYHNGKINHIIIKYRYLGIPFEKEIDLNEF